MSQNGDNKTDNTNPGYNNTLKEMSNFGLLPSTPCSSTTPGPPPFNITQTPFFVGKDPFYMIHPKTLCDINRNAGQFDTDDSLYEQEGFPMEIYNNFSIQSNGNRQYTHTTFTSPPQTEQFQMNVGLETPKRTISSTPIPHNTQSAQSPVNLRQSMKPSPSLLQRTNSPKTLNQPIESIQIPFKQSEGQKTKTDNIWHHKSSFLGDLGVALNRMGINQIISVFIAVQFNLYMSKRDGMSIINNTNPIDESFENRMLELENKIMRQMEQEHNKTTKSIKNVHDSLEDAVRRNTENIAINKEEIVEKEQQINDLSHIVDQKANNFEGFEAMRIYYEYESRTNWISHIIASPKVIPYAFNENGAIEQQKKRQNDDRGILDVVADGFQIWSDQQLGRNKREIIGNRDIADVATSATLRPFDCLQFAVSDKESQFIEVSLIEKMKPFEFVYIHIDKDKLDKKDRNKSPKRFRFYGRVRLDDVWTIMEVKEDKILNVNESMMKLEFEQNTGFKYMRIEYDVNEGTGLTRIYRMRIHAET